MHTVFVSSVIEGYENQRQAARKAITLTRNKPVMVEDFAARPHSPRVACLTEVGQSDIYLLLMGSRYGTMADQGLSVTHAEFREAKATDRIILALIEDVEMEPEQAEFRKEVENLETGVFRQTFASPEEVKDKAIEALIEADQAYNAASEKEFEQRLEKAENAATQSRYNLGANQEPTLVCAWWPQPAREVEVVGLENRLDQYFHQMSQAGIAAIRDGYEPVTGADHTGLRCGEHTLSIFSDGLIWFTANPTVERQGQFFSGMFVSPSRVRKLALAAATLFEANGAWCHVRLRNMEHKNFSEPPDASQRSISMPMMGKNNVTRNKLLIPITPRAYEKFVETTIARFDRVLSARH